MFQNCATTKLHMNQSGNYETAIKNAILDFNSTSMAKRGKVFVAYSQELDSGIIVVVIHSPVNKVKIFADGTKSTLPTRYIEYNNKLYYWHDSTSSDVNTISKLNEYQAIDSLQDLSQAVLNHDDAKKGMYYYFCKRDLSYFKKVISNRLLRESMPRNFSCKNK